MDPVLRVEFGRARIEVVDYADEAAQALRLARRLAGMDREQWARRLAPDVACGTVTEVAVECYEDGANVSGADYFLAAMVAAGFPLHRLLSAWLDDQLRDIVVGAVGRGLTSIGL